MKRIKYFRDTLIKANGNKQLAQQMIEQDLSRKFKELEDPATFYKKHRTLWTINHYIMRVPIFLNAIKWSFKVLFSRTVVDYSFHKGIHPYGRRVWIEGMRKAEIQAKTVAANKINGVEMVNTATNTIATYNAKNKTITIWK